MLGPAMTVPSNPRKAQTIVIYRDMKWLKISNIHVVIKRKWVGTVWRYGGGGDTTHSGILAQKQWHVSKPEKGNFVILLEKVPAAKSWRAGQFCQAKPELSLMLPSTFCQKERCYAIFSNYIRSDIGVSESDPIPCPNDKTYRTFLF